MDWLRLFALLIAVASVPIAADGPKKKIRIHLPQKVKHIHHHKKIYITNHPASSQYAPAYLPSAEGAVAVPSNVGLPAVANYVPINSVELFDDHQGRGPGVPSSASKLLPLYKARGYYGTTPSNWDDQEYDLSPPPEQEEDVDYTGPAAPSPPERNYPPKRVKVIKMNETPRKKPTRKPKPKRAPPRNPRPQAEDEHPVSVFHEQFYSDVDGLGTVRKIRKPQRVEKIVDGDTEHIHTYSEEHIHKVVLDEAAKIFGVDPAGNIPPIGAPRPLLPFNGGQAILTIPSESLSGFAAVSPIASPSNLEYAAYNPRDVTHDHIFHDHGEIPSGLDLTKDSLSYPPKISYNSQGLRIGNGKRYKSNKTPKPKPSIKPATVNDYTYYENLYTPFSGIKKAQKPQSEGNVDSYRPYGSHKFSKQKSRAISHSASDYRSQEPGVTAPFSVSSTIVHDYQPKSFPGALPPTGFSKFKDPFANVKGNYPSNFEYDTYASSSNDYHASDDKNENSILSIQGGKGKKKSMSSQNIRFGGQDHESLIDHVEESAVALDISDEETPTALDNFSSYDDTKSPDSVTSTPFTIRESSPVHQYYAAMAVKALQGEQGALAAASNLNLQYAEPPTPSTTPKSQVTTTSTSIPNYFDMQNSNVVSTQPTEYMSESEQRRKNKPKTPKAGHDLRQRYPVLQDYKADDRPSISHKITLHGSAVSSALRGQLKYGDKI